MESHVVPEPLGQRRNSGSQAQNFLLSAAMPSCHRDMKQGDGERQQGNKRKTNPKLKEVHIVGITLSERNSFEAQNVSLLTSGCISGVLMQLAE